MRDGLIDLAKDGDKSVAEQGLPALKPLRQAFIGALQDLEAMPRNRPGWPGRTLPGAPGPRGSVQVSVVARGARRRSLAHAWILRSITAPMAEFQQGVERLGQGDFTASVEAGNRGRIRPYGRRPEPGHGLPARRFQPAQGRAPCRCQRFHRAERRQRADGVAPATRSATLGAAAMRPGAGGLGHDRALGLDRTGQPDVQAARGQVEAGGAGRGRGGRCRAAPAARPWTPSARPTPRWSRRSR